MSVPRLTIGALLLLVAAGCLRPKENVVAPKSTGIYWEYVGHKTPAEAYAAYFAAVKDNDVLTAMKSYGPEGQDYAIGQLMLQYAAMKDPWVMEEIEKAKEPTKEAVKKGLKVAGDLIAQFREKRLWSDPELLTRIGLATDKRSVYEFMVSIQPKRPTQVKNIRIEYPAEAHLKNVDLTRGTAEVEFSWKDGSTEKQEAEFQEVDGQWSLRRPAPVPRRYHEDSPGRGDS